MSENPPLLSLIDLPVPFPRVRGRVRTVGPVSVDIDAGETVSVVGAALRNLLDPWMRIVR